MINMSNLKLNLTSWLTVVLSVLFTVNIAAAQEGLNKVDAQGMKQGKWQKKYPNTDVVRYEGQFKNNEPVGTFRHYNESSQLESIVEHRGNGVSYVKFLNLKNGQVRSEGKYADQKKDSLWVYYRSNKLPVLKETFSLGVLDGVRSVYDLDGRLIEKSWFTAGKQTGPFRNWFQTGALKDSGQYVDGARHGKYVSYFANGKPELQGEYEYGKPEGEWRIYNKEDGSLRLIIQYEDNTHQSEEYVNGEFLDFYSADKLKSKYNYRDGKLHGEFIEYYDNGDWVEVEKPDPQRQTTDMHLELRGQTIKKQGKYVNGKLHGKIISYDENGKEVSNETYLHGKLQ